MRHAGAKGQLTVRADSGFYTHAVVAVCHKTKVRFSITIRHCASLRNLIEAIPEADWTPIPYWMYGAADVAETTCTPFRTEPDAAPVRLIVRRVKPMPGSQPGPLRHLQLSRFHHRPVGGYPGAGGRPSPPRRDRECDTRPEARRRAEPSPLGAIPCQRRLTGGTGHGPQPGPLDSADRSGRAGGDHQDPPAAFLRPGGTAHPLGTPHDPSATDPPSRSPRAPLAVSYPAISLATATVGRHRRPQKRLQTARQPPVYPNSSPDHRACNSLTPLPLSSRRPSVDSG